MAASGATTIARARVIGVHGADRALATRLAVAGMLAGADLRPPGLPPAAVLIVDRLALPIDRRLPVRPGGRLDPAWERAARDVMAELYRAAVRPLDGQVPPGCRAVLFRDEAELLACLALDISRGRAGERWWWQSYGKRWGRLTPDALVLLLANSPRSTPAALRILAEWGAVASVLQHFSPGEARTLLWLVCDAFAAPQPDLATASHIARRLPSASAFAAQQSGEGSRDAPPWRPYLPPGLRLTDLPPESACLLGVALTLAHSPSVAQGAAFTQAAERWWRAEVNEPRVGVEPQQPLAEQPAHAEPNLSPAANGRMAQPPAGASDPPAAVEIATDRQAKSELPTSRKVGNSAEVGNYGRVGNFDAAPDRDVPPVAPLRVDNDPVAMERVEPVERLDGVATELGGVLFLINLMQRLDLPGCFEADWQLASQVGPWGTLELLARGLLTELPTFGKVGNSDFASDPLWSALAAIDGRRAGVLPGGAVTLPTSLRVPANWARWLDVDAVIVRLGEANSGRVSGIASPGLAMTIETLTPLEGPLLQSVSRDLRVWLAAVTPLLLAILSNVLGEDFDPVSDLLLRRGQLYVTSSHVDLVMPLGSVAMSVRIAGLDFDPGWLPGFGRVVQFHYE